MAENSKRGYASIIVINEKGDAMQYPPNDDPGRFCCTNFHIASILEEGGILSDALSKHLEQNE